MTTRDAAIAAARAGRYVFPCRPGDKRPAIDRWEQRACADPERIARYWPARANVGIACGPSGLVVVDMDAAEGDQPDLPSGARNFDQLHREHGQVWGDTLTVRTPRRGWHLYYSAIPGREIRNSASRLAPHVDIRGSGGYVIGAGSVIGGRLYSVILARPVAQLPEWLAELLAPARRPALAATSATRGPAYGRLRGLLEHVLGGQPGDRNGRLFWAGCRAAELIAAGLVNRDAAEAALVQAALDAGLRGGEAEARRTVSSAMGTTA